MTRRWSSAKCFPLFKAVHKHTILYLAASCEVNTLCVRMCTCVVIASSLLTPTHCTCAQVAQVQFAAVEAYLKQLEAQTRRIKLPEQLPEGLRVFWLDSFNSEQVQFDRFWDQVGVRYSACACKSPYDM